MRQTPPGRGRVKNGRERIAKKLREAEFFLSKMREREPLAFGDKEPFDFYLSAFLNAARTVEFRLHHVEGPVYAEWRKHWIAMCTDTEKRLIKFLIKDRNFEIHQTGSHRNTKPEDITIGNSYSDASGTLEVFTAQGSPPTTVQRPTYSFTIGGIERRVTEACGEYCALLKGLVTEFTVAHP